MQLENKVAAVTGGTAGIGKAIVEIFLENGAKVAMMARNSEKAEKVISDLGAGDRLIFIKGDSNELLERFQKEGVPCAPLLDRMELMDHEQITANETIWYDNFEGFGQIRQARPAARFSETESEIVRPAPKLGEHGLEILSDLGYEKSLQQRLIDEGKLVVKND